MPYNYLKVAIEEKNWRFQKFDFLGLGHQFSFGELQLKKVSFNFKTYFNLNITGLGAKFCVA